MSFFDLPYPLTCFELAQNIESASLKIHGLAVFCAFLFQKHLEGEAFFDPSNFLSTVAGANVMLPYGVPFDSLSFLYPTPALL